MSNQSLEKVGSAEVIQFNDVIRMAQAFAKSGLFGIKTVEQACALMWIAQAEGKHPATAAMEYDIIQNKPSLKASALLARFQASGGKVEWHDYTDTKVSGTFSHAQGGSVTVEWTVERAKSIIVESWVDGKKVKSPLADKMNWKNWPREMMRSRCIGEGVRTVHPGDTSCFYTKEEVMDMEQEPVRKQPKQTQPQSEANTETESPELKDSEPTDVPYEEILPENQKATTDQLKSLSDLGITNAYKMSDTELNMIHGVVKNGCSYSVFCDWTEKLKEIAKRPDVPTGDKKPAQQSNEPVATEQQLSAIFNMLKNVSLDDRKPFDARINGLTQSAAGKMIVEISSFIAKRKKG